MHVAAPDHHGAHERLPVTHLCAILEPATVGEPMRNIAAGESQPTAQAALTVFALLVQQPGKTWSMER